LGLKAQFRWASWILTPWANLQISRAATLDSRSEVPIADWRTIAISVDHIAYFEVILDLSLQQVSTLVTNRTHNAVLGKNNGIGNNGHS
jgi:hypothetical protein